MEAPTLDELLTAFASTLHEQVPPYTKHMVAALYDTPIGDAVLIFAGKILRDGSRPARDDDVMEGLYTMLVLGLQIGERVSENRAAARASATVQ
jgi:hypothetical protein